MSQIEFVITGYSMIVALCVARLLDGIPPAFGAGRRYWIHQLWIVNKLMNTMLLFWTTWALIQDRTITFVDFAIISAPPGILYLQISALLTSSPEAVNDWRRRYYDTRQWFFAANVALSLATLFNLHVIIGAPSLTRASVVLLFNVALSTVCIFTANPRFHAITVVLAFLGLTFGIAANVAVATTS